MYPLKAATIKACLHKILNDYVANVRRSENILGDNGTQVASKNWKKIIGRHGNRGHPPPADTSPASHPKRKMCDGNWQVVPICCLEAHKDGQNYCRTFKAGSTALCRIELATALLS